MMKNRCYFLYRCDRKWKVREGIFFFIYECHWKPNNSSEIVYHMFFSSETSKITSKNKVPICVNWTADSLSHFIGRGINLVKTRWFRIPGTRGTHDITFSIIRRISEKLKIGINQAKLKHCEKSKHKATACLSLAKISEDYMHYPPPISSRWSL